MTRTTLSQNIIALRKHLGMNQEQFGQAVGSAQTNVTKWEGKGIVPSAAPLARMAELANCPVSRFVDHPWKPATDVNVSPVAQSLEDFAAEHGLALVEELDLALGMGATYLDGSPPEVLGIVPFRAEWLRGMVEGPIERLKVVRGRGDSMEPTIHDGDVVLIDTAHRRIDDQDRIWAVAYGEFGMIRRVRVTPRGSWLLMPDNSVVRPDEVGDGEVAVIGRVIWIGRRI